MWYSYLLYGYPVLYNCSAAWSDLPTWQRIEQWILPQPLRHCCTRALDKDLNQNDVYIYLLLCTWGCIAVFKYYLSIVLSRTLRLELLKLCWALLWILMHLHVDSAIPKGKLSVAGKDLLRSSYPIIPAWTQYDKSPYHQIHLSVHYIHALQAFTTFTPNVS